MTTRESERSTPRAPSWAGLGIAGVGVVQFLADGARGGAAVLVAALLCGAAVALARRAPVVAAGGVLLSVTAMTLLIGVPLFATFLALMLIAFALARYGARRQVMEGGAMILAAIAAVAVPELRHGRDGLFGLVYPTVHMGGAALLGWLTRQHADAAELRDRERRQAAQLAVVEERARLAREMHDVISHGVSLMVVQAEAGSEVLGTRPEAAASALEAIAGTDRSAMEDLHHMLGLLQHTASEDLDALAARVRAASLTVMLEVHPGWSTLAEPTRLALFRVAQEAITNTLRHAEAAGELSIRYRQALGVATMEVWDDGIGSAGTGRELSTMGAARPSGAHDGLGTGLAGLRRRLMDLGGTLDASEVGTGGFLVRAGLPLVPR